MSLPKIDLPLFELTIPSSGKKVKYRPFTVKEEKILLIAQQSQSMEQIILALKQIISNCVKDVDVDNLPTFDLEYIILNIRAKSVNNEIELIVKDEYTDADIKLKIDLNTIHLKRNENHKKNIQINNEYILVMKYPTIDKVLELQNEDENEASYNLMISCVDILASVDGEKIYKFSDFTKQEVEQFIEGLNAKTIEDIKEFFETLPVLKIDIPYKNSKGEDKIYTVEGLGGFFI